MTSQTTGRAAPGTTVRHPARLRRGFGSDTQAGAESLELGVSDDAALVQFRQFPERLGGVGVGRSTTGGRGPLGPGCCRR
jgi:hypothetical protein